MDAQPKIGGFGCFKGVLQIPFFLLMQFHKAIFYFNPKMGHMLNLAIVDKLNRAGFVVAPYNTPEEVPSVKSVSGPARHVGEADKRVRDSRGGSPCGENRCGIGECREGEGTRGAPQERAKLTRTIFYILRSEVSSIEKYDAPISAATNVFLYLGLGLSLSLQFSCFSLSFLFLLFFGLWFR